MGIFALFIFLPIDEIVAVIDNKPILYSDVEYRLNLFFLQFPFVKIKDTTQIKKEILNQLINQEVIKKIAEKESLFVEEERISEEARKMLESIEIQLDSMPELKKMMEERNLDLLKIENMLQDELYARYIGEFILSKKGYSNPYVSPKEIKEFYEKHKDSIALIPGKVKLAHILLVWKPSPKKEEKAFRKIMEIYDILLRGGDFPVVAESFSEDLKTKKRGGLVGWLTPKELLPEIDTAVSSLSEGEISPPVRARDGYHIFKCEKRRKNSLLLRHILVKINIGREDTLFLLNKAKKLSKILKNNPERFEDFARKYSEDLETKEKGGYLGEFFIKGLAPPFNKVVKKLKAGEISDPVSSPFGVHIIKVIEKEEDRIRDFEDIKEEVKSYLVQRKKEEILNEIIEDAKEEIFIEIKAQCLNL